MNFCVICENEEHYKDKKIRIYNSYWCELISYEINFCPLCGKHLQPDLDKDMQSKSDCQSANKGQE